ncbi:helix-turn-helix transcriptional regulator [Deefgea piscis]|uniref:helix-turn-helix transcriptional regulator n=1 Tax=Deefgea piscis TaxID=2739061 RepID=UPI001C7FEB95|nr:helix-turn-helix domain-containing protein [Deefgea piscis]QZA82555.1 helix-turn-helix domain-containing protein [Deefgea piscis]
MAMKAHAVNPSLQSACSSPLSVAGMRPRVLRPRNAALYLQVSKSTLDRLVAAGKLKPPFKNGTAMALFDVADLDRYLDEVMGAA